MEALKPGYNPSILKAPRESPVQWNPSNPPMCTRRRNVVLRVTAARAIWSRFASPRAELVGSPSLSRPNLFAGD